MGAAELTGQLAAARHQAENDDATVVAVVDGAGQLVEVRIEPKAVRLDSARLGATVTDTVQAAQAAARAALPEVTSAPAPDTESLSRLAAELGATAQLRLTEIAGTLDRLVARHPDRAPEV